jgi:hypothetical protein
MKNIEDLRDINSDAIDRMEKTVTEIDTRLDDPSISLANESRLISRRATLQAQINNQMMIQAHLKASKIIVEFTNKEESDLEKLNEKMDAFVITGLTLNAFLGLIPKIIDTAVSIGNTTTSHSGQA